MPSSVRLKISHFGATLWIAEYKKFENVTILAKIGLASNKTVHIYEKLIWCVFTNLYWT